MGRKLTYEFVREQIDNIQDYELLSTEYVSANDKLLVKHLKCGYEYWVTYAKIVTCGRRCPVCAGTQKQTINEIRVLAEKENYQIISTEYKNALSKLEWKCPEKHIFWMRWNDFQQGHRCKKCSNKAMGLRSRLKIENIKKYIESFEGYLLLSTTYNRNDVNLIVMHIDCGHKYEVTYNNFQRGTRCPKCANNGTSKAEQEIQKFVKSNISLFDNIICNDRTQIINPSTGRFLELDVYLPSLNKAIEFNGAYWHSLEDVIVRDKIKQEECKKLGIELLTIYEENYIIDKNKEFEKIKIFLESSYK